MASNFNCLIESEELFNVIGSHIHGKSDNISKMVQDRDLLLQITNRKWYMAYQIVAVPMSLSEQAF